MWPDMMTIGIATISRNSGPFLERAVRSVLESSYPNLKYVVQDGASSDGSANFLHGISDPRLQFFSEPDSGPADGLNRAFRKLSDCEVVGWLNSDDLLLSGSLEFIVHQFQKDPNLTFLQGAGIVIDQNDFILSRFVPRKYSPLLARLRVTSMFQPSLYMRRTSLEIPPFNPHNRSCWDSELLYRACCKGYKVRRSQRPLAAFRLHSGSISGSGRLTDTYYEEESSFLGEPPLPSPLRRVLSFTFGMEAHFRALMNPKHVSRSEFTR